MMLLMCCAALAGCLDSDEETTEEETTEEVDETPAWLDASDAGYTYASNVDNHRSLMKDLCDIKSAADLLVPTNKNLPPFLAIDSITPKAS